MPDWDGDAKGGLEMRRRRCECWFLEGMNRDISLLSTTDADIGGCYLPATNCTANQLDHQMRSSLERIIQRTNKRQCRSALSGQTPPGPWRPSTAAQRSRHHRCVPGCRHPALGACHGARTSLRPRPCCCVRTKLYARREYSSRCRCRRHGSDRVESRQ